MTQAAIAGIDKATTMAQTPYTSPAMLRSYSPITDLFKTSSAAGLDLWYSQAKT